MMISARSSAYVATFALLSMLVTTGASGQRPGGGSGMRFPSSVAISPDGTVLASTIGGREGSQLHIIDVFNPDPAKDKIVTPNGETNCSNSSPVWSPDGMTLAYTSPAPARKKSLASSRFSFGRRPPVSRSN